MAGNSRTRYRFQDPYSTDDYLPAAGLLSGTLLVAEVAGDSSGKGEVATMLEASIFSAVTAEGLKYASGREQPNEALDPNDWRMSGSSFPSLHSDLAFASGTVFAKCGDDDYRWFRRFIGYGSGTATVYCVHTTPRIGSPIQSPAPPLAWRAKIFRSTGAWSVPMITRKA
jgi:hypothetical protein